MVSSDNGYLEQFETSIAGWEDERFVSRKQLRALALFFCYLVNLSENDGWVYDGHSLKIGTPMSVLVVKATVDGVPHVVFTSARTATGCVVTFIRKLEAELLEWQKDKYRQ